MFVGFYYGRGLMLELFLFFFHVDVPMKWLWTKSLKWMVRNDPEQMLQVSDLWLLKLAAERGMGRQRL